MHPSGCDHTKERDLQTGLVNLPPAGTANDAFPQFFVKIIKTSRPSSTSTSEFAVWPWQLARGKCQCAEGDTEEDE